MERHVNDQGQPVLTDDMIVDWHLDPGLVPKPGGGFDFDDPLVLPTVGSWPHRPESATAIQNLILAGDYVRGDWEVANMEIANESGRRAANAILERSGRIEPRVQHQGHERVRGSHARVPRKESAANGVICHVQLGVVGAALRAPRWAVEVDHAVIIGWSPDNERCASPPSPTA